MTFQETTATEHPVELSKGDTREIAKLKAALDKLCTIDQPTPKMMRITPLMALLMLARNIENNRNITERKVTAYAADMQAGNWGISSDAIAFDKTGHLLNGQHRLVACRRADHTFDAIVMFGMDDDMFLRLDQGKKRSKADTLHTQGWKDAPIAAAAGGFVYGYQHKLIGFGANSWTGHYEVSVTELSQFVKGLPRFEEAVAFSRHLYNTGSTATRGVLGPSLTAGAYYILAEINQEQAKDFIERLILGTGLDITDIIYKLRNRLLSRERSGQPIRNRFKMAYVVKTWNAWRKGEDLRYMTWAKNEQFPEAQ